MTTQPAGEHHTGTLNLAGEGNAPQPDRDAEENLQRLVADAVYDDLLTALYPWRDRMAVEDINVITQGVADAALAAAEPAIRQHVAEQIAAACDQRYESNLALTGGDQDIIPRDGRVGLATGYQRAAKIAREIGGSQ